ncbi:MAG: hypothetical protein KAY24_19880 [Candidatus Eisenbacteria sp.]|nr:hypothetical protein [Candidatus Eisenbacteria bacterium]
MATAFAKVLLEGPVVTAMGEKKARYKVQMGESHTGAGEAFDVSAEFDYVKEASAIVSGAVGDLGYVFAIIGGTYNAANRGYPAASIKLAAHRGLNGGGAAAPFDPCDSVDLKAINDLIVTIVGT